MIEAAFPFHLRLDAHLIVRSFGRSLPLLCPGIAAGDSLGDHVSTDLPDLDLFASARLHPATPVVLTTRAGAVPLRCQVLPDGADGLAVLAAPWLPGAGELARAGLLLNDFAPHDPSPDYAFLSQVQLMALDDARRLAERLAALESARRYESLHDSMTGAGNRRQFTEALSSAPEGTALVLVDVDYFKEINDTHGHEVGDAILTALVARLTKLGPDAAIIARLGGDEFGVLFTGSDAASASHLFAQGIVDAMQEPIDCDGAIITASVSVGLMSGGDPEVLTRNADVALYSAKQRGRNRVVTFDAALHRSLLHRLEVRDRLTEAVATSQITIVYQPIVDLATGQLHGFEALARWNDRELGHVSPDVFIAVAEEAGLISELGRFVLNTSCQQLAQWRAYFPQLNLSMSVNLAPRQLEDPNLTAYVATALKTYELPATSLQLELTESAFTSQRRHEDHLKRLRDLGVRLAIDDFGSAESTLARLHTVPASTLKIDRAFLLESDTEPERCRRLLSAVVGIANALGMTTVAEGIETPEQLAIIKDVGCTYGQGYLHSRPLSAEDATAFLQQG